MIKNNLGIKMLRITTEIVGSCTILHYIYELIVYACKHYWSTISISYIIAAGALCFTYMFSYIVIIAYKQLHRK